MIEGVPLSRVVVAVGREPTEAERAEVTALVGRFRSRRDTFDLSLVEDYVRSHPDSPYAPSLHFALGLAAQGMARYQETFTHLEAAWQRFEGARSRLARDQADRVVAELAVMHAQLGHREALRPLFASLRTRPPLGGAAERLNQAFEGYQTMELDPGRAYLCGPLALRSVWRASHEAREEIDARISAVRSTHQGTSVAQLAELASAAGMNLHAARHPVGTPWASPMVVHWKVGHFAAIIEQQDLGQGRALYLVRDPTFGEDRWTTGAILDQEASGVVLASSTDPRTAAWPAISDEEARSTWGRGATTSGQAGDWGKGHWMEECGVKRKHNMGSKGMARRHLVTHLATLAIEDTPLWNNPAVGDPLEFQPSYNQADWLGTPPWMSTLGPRWRHNWHAEIELYTTTTWLALGNYNGQAHSYQQTLHTAVIMHPRDGGDIYYRLPPRTEFDPLPDTIDYATNARLVFHHGTGNEVTSITRELPDHTVETYTHFPGQNYPLTEVRDAQGRVTTVNYATYGSKSRLGTVVAPSGTMTFHYDTTDPDAETFHLIRSVSIGDREATLTYANMPGEALPDGGVGDEGPLLLTGITDMGGITSTFEYGAADRGLDPHENHAGGVDSVPDPTFLRYMTTPYGRTEFRTGWALNGTESTTMVTRQIHRRRWLDVIYPGGERERLARQDIDQWTSCTDTAVCFPHTIAIPPSYGQALLANAGIYLIEHSFANNARNSFFWDTTAFARARARNPSGTGEPEDWDLNIHDAHTYHWLHAAWDPNRASSILESEVEAGELRVFYLHQNQSRPEYLNLQPNPAYSSTPSGLVTGVFRQVSTSGTTDQNDRVTRMTYTSDGRLASVTDDEGQKLLYAYTTDGDLERVTRDVGSGTQELLAAFTYGTSHPHLPLTARDSTNLETSFAYNTNHQLTTITRPDSSTVTYGYDGTTHRLTSVTSPAGASSTTYNTRGLPATTTSVEGITRGFTYDDLDRVLTITAPGSRTVTFDYRYRDENGALALDTNGDPFQALEATSVTGVDGNASIRSYDALHRLRYSTTSGGSDPTRYRYDVVDGDWFHRVEMRRASGGGTVPTTQWSVPVNPMVNTHSTRPTRLRRGVSGAYEDTLYAYNAAGELTSVTAPDTTVTTFEYDEVGRTTRTCHNSGCTERDEITYDVLRDRVTASESVNASGSVERVLSYGAATVVDDPMPTATLPNANRVVELEELTHTGMTLTDSNETTYGYDALGRLTQSVHGGETLGFEYDLAGRFTGIINNATTPATPVLTHQYTSSVTSRRPSYSFLPRTNCVQDFIYQSSSDDHRMFSSWLFNASTWQTLAKIDLTFTTDGRLNSEQNERDWRYFYYNAARRLEFHSEYVNNGSGTYNLESGNDAYYDAWGNTTSISRYQDWGGGSWSWSLLEGRTFSLSDRLLTRAMGPSASPTHTLTYDARGRVTGDGEFTYGWDAHDRLTTVTRVSDSQSWTFGYDASGRLTSMVEGAETVKLRWRGAALLGERIEASGSSPIVRTYRPDGMEQDGAHLALVRDVRGSVIGLATGGERVRTYRYGVWGEQTVVAPTSTPLGAYDTHLGFTGHVVHRPTGLVFAPARVYSPRLRQWLTRDPLGERDAVDGRNLYAYVAGDPVNWVDPTGMMIRRPRGASVTDFFMMPGGAFSGAGFRAGLQMARHGLVGSFIRYTFTPVVALAGIYQAATFAQIQDMARRTFPEDVPRGAETMLEGGRGDAFQHCAASCEFSSVFTSYGTEVGGALRELVDLKDGSSRIPHCAMDLRNNHAGASFNREQGGADRCVELCAAAAHRDLRVVEVRGH